MIYRLLLPTLLTFHFSNAQQCRLVRTGSDNNGNGGVSDPSIPYPSVTPIANGTQPGGSGGNGSTPAFPKFVYGKDTIRGVNLGGWFVLEPWITPSIFENTGNDDIVDEYTFGMYQDADTALSVLQEHWETWITEDDFVQIAQAGLNHVRIPLGYWSIPITKADTTYNTSAAPYIPGAWPYFVQALTWAKAHGVNTIVDIHGAPGSQNGYDTSGHRTSSPSWGTSQTNINRTIDIVKFLANNLSDKLDVIELLNEPAAFLGSNWATALRSFWKNGYQTVRDAAGDDIGVMIGDGFLGVNSWTNFLSAPDATGVTMDKHMYQIFSNEELARSYSQHLDFVCEQIPTYTTFASDNIWTIIGEWSTAPNDCTKWLNGRGVGIRWEGTWGNADQQQYFGSCQNLTGNYKTFSDDYKKFLGQYWEAQVTLGENINGWIYWTWKAENSDEWSYSKGIEGGWIPKNATNRMYNLCN